MHIRQALPADAHDVLTWLNDVDIWQIDCPHPYQRRTYAEFAPYWSDILSNHAAWMLTVERKPVGQLGWVLHSNEVAEFFITIGDRHDRGRGYGRQAMAWLEQQAQAAGLVRLVGTVLGNNDKAQTFFTQLGFKLTRVWAHKIVRDGRTFPLYSFEKELASR